MAYFRIADVFALVRGLPSCQPGPGRHRHYRRVCTTTIRVYDYYLGGCFA